MRDKIESFLTM